MGKVRVCSAAELAEGCLRKVSADGTDVMVANISGEYHAVSDTCTHSGASLADGKLEGHTVTCGWHGAQFDCKSGKLEKFPAKINDLKQYKTVVEEGDLFVETE